MTPPKKEPEPRPEDRLSDLVNRPGLPVDENPNRVGDAGNI